MGELIAIPLESDRRAVEVLATLRRLQAEYRGASESSAGAADGALPLGLPLGRRRRLWRRLRSVALVTLIGGAAALVAGLAVAVHNGALAPGLSQLGSVPAQALLTGGGLLIGAACATLFWRLHRRALPRVQSPRTVTWLVSYIMQDGPARASGSTVRASVFQITLPVEAEGRLKAILARADATAAR